MHPFVPGHALYEKDSQKHKKVGTIVNNHKMRALFVLLIDHRSGDELLMNPSATARFFLPSVYLRFCLFVLLNRIGGDVLFDVSLDTKRFCLLGKELCWHPGLPEPAPPTRRAPRPDPPVVCSHLGFHTSTTDCVSLLVFKGCPCWCPKSVAQEVFHPSSEQVEKLF